MNTGSAPSNSSLVLPMQVDSESLKAELSRVAPDEWRRHYNVADYGGDWSGVALRSRSGLTTDLIAQAGSEFEYQDTPLLGRLPGFSSFLCTFQCRLRAVRLLSLSPDSVVREHCDSGLSPADGEVRIHVPVQTSDAVEFYLDGERLRLDEGNVYFIDASRRHRVRNRGEEPRVHLVVDAERNRWLEAMLGQGRPAERLPVSPAGFDAFRRQVLVDAALQEELQSSPTPAALKGRAVLVGRARGFDFDEDDVVPGVLSTEASPGRRWLPAGVRFCESEIFVEHIHIADRGLTEPFFEDSVRAILCNPFARFFKYEVSLSQLNITAAPAGFIFHMSRCGSTLVAQTFSALPQVNVISEPPLLDDFIQDSRVHELEPKKRERGLRGLIAALGQAGGRESYIVKLDAWHIHDLPLIRAVFPQTPWVFVYRDPIEVFVSQMRLPGKLALPGAIDPAILKLDTDAITLPREEWTAQVLAHFYESAILHADDHLGLFLNYRELPDAIWGRLCRHFSIALSGEDLKRMCGAALMNVKMPGVPFQADSGAKIGEASASMEHLTERIIRPAYLELERLVK